jgi:uncharacterized protein involved in outer membrane biogenesis
MGRLLVFLAGLLVVALFSALLAPLFVDWSNFRKDFETQASIILGKKVVVLGSVDARILPFPSVTLNDVRVGPQADGTALITVERFSMDAELAPFLSGEAKIYDMRLEKPKANIKLLSDGTLDWVRTGKLSIPAKTVILEHVSISDGEIRFEDEQTGRTRLINKLNASLSAKSLAGPWRVDGTGALDGATGRFTLATGVPDAGSDLRVKARLMPDAQQFDLDLEGALKIVDLKPVYEGDFTASAREDETQKQARDATTMATRVKGKFTLTNESIQVPEYRLEAGNVVDPYVVTGEATLDTGARPEFLLTAEGQQIDVSGFGNSGESAKTDRTTVVPASARLQALMALAADIPIPQVPGRASLKLPALIAGDTTLRDIAVELLPNGTGWRVEKATAQLPGRTQVEASGDLTLAGEQSFKGDLLLASNQPSGLASWLSGSVDPAIRPLKTAGFSATVNLTPQIQAFESLEVNVGPAILRGRVEHQSGGDSTGNLSVDLSGDRLDLDAMRALLSLFTGADAKDDFFAQDIAAKLTADHFTAFGAQADGVSTTFSYSGGELALNRLEIASLAGAKISLSGVVSGSLEKPNGDLAGHVVSDDPAAFLQLLHSKVPQHPVLDRLAGNANYYSGLDVMLSLKAGGGGAWPVTATLKGKANGSKISANYSAETVLPGPDTAASFDATLENPVTTVLMGQAGLEPLPFDTEPDGILGVNIAQDPGEAPTAILTFTTPKTTLTVKGDTHLDAGHFLEGHYDVSLESEDLEPYLLMNGYGLPGMGTGLPIMLKSSLSVSPEAIAFADLQGKADENGFSGALTLSRLQENTAVTGTIALDTVDLSWLGEGVFGPLYTMDTAGLSGAPLSAAMIGGFSVDVGLKAKNFWPGIYGPFTGFDSSLTFKDGALQLAGAKADYAGGKVTGDLSMANTQGSGFLQGKIAVEGANTAAISWSQAEKPVVSGHFDLALALEASGKTLAEMLDNSSGSGNMTLKDTVLTGLRADGFAEILKQVDALKTDPVAGDVAAIVQSAVDGTSTKLGQVVLPFTIASGELRADTISAANPEADFTAKADIDLKALTIDAALRLHYKPGDEALDGADPAVTFGWKGLLEQPDRTLDTSEFANFLSLRKFETEQRRVEALQDNVLEKQRLRREASLYKELASARALAAQQESLRKQAEEKLKALARENLLKQASPPVPVQPAPLPNAVPGAPQSGVLRGIALPPPAQ